MSSEFVRRMKSAISRAEHASPEMLDEIEDELERDPSAELWILRGDAIQLSDADDSDLDDAARSYLEAIELDPNSADAYESLGHFTFAVNDDARGSIEFFRKAIELGAGASAREGLREAEEELDACAD